MSTQQSTRLWQAIMHAPMPEPAKRIHIGLGEHRHVWLDSDMRNFARQVAEPIEKQRMELLKLLEVAQDDLILLSRCANVDHKERASIAAIKTAMAAIGKAEGGEG